MGEATTADICVQCRAGKHVDIVGEFDDNGEPIQNRVETCACWACFCMAQLDPAGGSR